MPEKKGMYNRQPAYNEFLVPTCPPSYSEAISTHTTSYDHVSPVPPPYSPGNCAVPGGAPFIALPPQPSVTVPVCVGPNSSAVTCPNCNNKVNTKTRSVSQKSAHIACCLMCLFGCFLCSCIPYCMKSFQNINHYCPVCKAFLGVYKS